MDMSTSIGDGVLIVACDNSAAVSEGRAVLERVLRCWPTLDCDIALEPPVALTKGESRFRAVCKVSSPNGRLFDPARMKPWSVGNVMSGRCGDALPFPPLVAKLDMLDDHSA